MDEWNVDDVVDWFQTIGHMQYDKSIREHQVGELELTKHDHRDCFLLALIFGVFSSCA